MFGRDSDAVCGSSVRAIEQAIDRFETAWRAGDRLSIRAYCTLVGTADAALVVELAQIEFEYRCRAGERPAVEEYLHEFPELKEDDRAVIDLVAAEDRWWTYVGPTPDSKVDSSTEGDRPLSVPHVHDAHGSSEKPEAAQSGHELSHVHDSQDRGSDILSTKPFSIDSANLVSANDASRKIVLAGRFRLLDCLGEGGFGAVYRAVDLELDRVVAVKIPHGGVLGSKDERDRLLREARSAAQLRHPNIVPVYGVFQEEGRPFIVSALVAGPTLAALLNKRTFEPRAAAEVVAVLADALHFAHERHVVHRDVKPSNIILESPNFPVLMDFGLAKREGVDVPLTHEGQMVGTPAYMSPEQAAGEVGRIDARSDIYSLGVVLYESLTGERPFRGNVRMILQQVVNEDPRSPISLNDRVPRDLATICLKCMQKGPASRYQTARELTDDLRRFLRHEPIHARPVSILEREWRRIRRRPWTSGLIATVVALTITVAVVSTVAALRIDAARRRSEASAEESLHRLEQLYLVNGTMSVETENPFAACPWFVRAWNMRASEASRDAAYRLRLVTTMRRMPSLIQFWSHTGSGTHAQFSPDGRLVAVASSDRTAMLYDATQPEKDPTILKHRASVLQCEFDSSGERLVTVSHEPRVRVWQTRGGEREPTILKHLLPATCAAFSPDSLKIATGCSDGVVRFWNPSTGEAESRSLHHKGSITHLAFSRDGTYLATASADKTARLWHVQTGEPVGAPLVHDGPVNRVCFSLDAHRVFTASGDATARIWEVDTNQVRFVLRHAGPVSRLVHVPQQDWLITATDRGAVRVWDAANGSVIRDLPGHVDRILDVSLSPDGRRLATASEDNTARIWNLESGVLEYPLMVHPVAVAAIGFSRDSKNLVTAASDGTVRLWNLDKPFEWEIHVDLAEPAGHVQHSFGKLLITTTSGTIRVCTVDKKHHTTESLSGIDRVRASALAPRGNLLATAGNDGHVQLWDLNTSRPIGSFDSFGQPVDLLHFSQDGRRLLITLVGGKTYICDVQATRPMIALDHRTQVLSAGFGEHTAHSVDDNSVVKIWDTESGRLVSQVRTDNYKNASYFFSPSAALLVKAGRHGDAQVWRTSAMGIHHDLVGSRTVLHAAFSPNETTVITGGVDDVAQLWDVATGKPVVGPLRHGRDVTFCTFDARGQVVATASDDQTARIWDARTGDPLSPYLPHTDRVVFAGFQSEQDYLITVSADGVVRAWDLGDRKIPSKQLIRLARIAGGCEVNESGSLVPIGKGALEEDWREYERGLEALRGSSE